MCYDLFYSFLEGTGRIRQNSLKRKGGTRGHEQDAVMKHGAKGFSLPGHCPDFLPSQKRKRKM